MRWSRSSSAVLFGVALLVGSSWAHGQTADEAKAEELFNKAVELSEAHQYDQACPLLAESQKLDPRASTLFALGDCEREAGKMGSAVAHFKAYLKEYEAMKRDVRKRHDQRANSARSHIKKLEAEAPTLKLTFPGGIPAEFTVKRNGDEVNRIDLDKDIPVDPGEQVVIVEIPGHEPAEQRITVALKEKKVVELAPGPIAEKVDPDAQNASRKRRRTAGFVLMGTGVAGLAFGGVMGGLAVGQKGVVDEHCNGLDCDKLGLEAVDAGRLYGNLSTIGLAAGGVLAVAGLVVVLTAPKAAPTPTAGWLKGIDITPLRHGAFVGVEGQF